MNKRERDDALKQLPKLGCEECMPGGEGFRGLVYVIKPGQPRAVRPCRCMMARDKAKKELEAAK